MNDANCKGALGSIRTAFAFDFMPVDFAPCIAFLSRSAKPSPLIAEQSGAAASIVNFMRFPVCADCIVLDALACLLLRGCSQFFQLTGSKGVFFGLCDLCDARKIRPNIT